ncbi:MAG: HAMP domain-containing histidine kinase [Betaproteobacteria bacterium]|nr:HAMP domain-containing histidine kinase [Betaproteobacteria bacterium]
MRPSVPEPGDGELQIPLAGSDGRPMGSLAYALPSAGFSQEENTAALQLAAMVTASLEGWRLRQALAEAERQKDTFLAMLAHELRNPLAPLRAGLAILRISEPESDIALQARDMMERQLGHMVRLIDDLMDLERVTQGKIELRKERVELTSALRLAMETCGPAIWRKAVIGSGWMCRSGPSMWKPTSRVAASCSPTCWATPRSSLPAAG